MSLFSFSFRFCLFSSLFVQVQRGSTYVILNRPIPELVAENLKDFSSSPSLLAPRVVREMVR